MQPHLKFGALVAARSPSILISRILAICLALAVSFAPAVADEMEEEREAFGKIAHELVSQLRGKATSTLMGTRSGRPKVAVIPFKEEKLPLDSAYGREFNGLLISSLLTIANNRFMVMTRANLKTIIEELVDTGRMEPNESNAISALFSSNNVDVMIFGRVERVGDELSISYEAVNANSETVAQSAPWRLSWRPKYGRNVDAHTLKVAFKEAARSLATFAHDLRILRLGGIHYETSGELTDFSHYLEDGLSVAFKAEYASVLTGKKIRVENVRLSTNQLNAMRGIDLSGEDLQDENLGAEAGAYTLTGIYWLQGPIIEIRLSLTAPGGGSIGWTGGVFESDVGNVALRPEGDFGAWRRKDGMGPFWFTLTTDKGHDPVYRIGEKMTLLVQADRDIWLHCYSLQVNGAVFQIFPNHLQKDRKIEGRRLVTIPGKGHQFDFDIRPPAGKELVKCFALGSDIADQLPPEFDQEEAKALPASMKHKLPGLFRSLSGIAMTEQSTVINVVE